MYSINKHKETNNMAKTPIKLQTSGDDIRKMTEEQ